jgi:hypothetical protein
VRPKGDGKGGAGAPGPLGLRAWPEAWRFGPSTEEAAKSFQTAAAFPAKAVWSRSSWELPTGRRRKWGFDGRNGSYWRLFLWKRSAGFNIVSGSD